MGKNSKRKRRHKEKLLGACDSTDGVCSNPDTDTVSQSEESNSEVIKKLFNDAEAAVDSLDYEMAANIYRQILKLDPKNVDAMDILGGIYSELGSFDEAKSLWLKCIELSPNNGYSKYFALAQLFEGKESLNFYERGICLLERQLEEPENMQPEVNLTPENLKLSLSESYCAVAELYMTDLCSENNAADLFKIALDKSMAITPENAEPYRILASFLISQDELEEAKLAIQKNLDLWFPKYEALQDDPNSDMEAEALLPEYSTRIEIGKTLIELEMYEPAVKIFEGLLEEDDEVFLVWYLLGILYYSQGENYYQEAFSYFTKADEIAKKTGQKNTDEALFVAETLETLESAAKNVAENGKMDDECDLNENFSSSENSEEEPMES